MSKQSTSDFIIYIARAVLNYGIHCLTGNSKTQHATVKSNPGRANHKPSFHFPFSKVCDFLQAKIVIAFVGISEKNAGLVLGAEQRGGGKAGVVVARQLEVLRICPIL